MKKRMVVLLLGSALVTGMFGADAQAMTYAYSARESAGSVSEEEKQKMENWHKEEMRQQIAYLEKYGISYDADTDTLFYQGKKVRWLIDEQIDDTYMALQMPEGEIDVYTERGEDYQLTGLRVASQEEYDQRTRKDEAAEKKDGYYFQIEEGEYISGEDGGIVRYTPADGSVIHTYVEDESAALDDSDFIAEGSGVTYVINAEEAEGASEDITFRIDEENGEISIAEGNCTDLTAETADGWEDAVTGESAETADRWKDAVAGESAETADRWKDAVTGESVETADRWGDAVTGESAETADRWKNAVTGESTETADGTKDTAIDNVAEGFGFEEEDAKWRMTQKEYEEVGITYDSTDGAWIWQGKPVHFLMDENGSMYQNGSKEAKENKIYVLVTRDLDGSIAAAKQVTMEEVLKERMLQEEEDSSEKIPD